MLKQTLPTFTVASHFSFNSSDVKNYMDSKTLEGKVWQITQGHFAKFQTLSKGNVWCYTSCKSFSILRIIIFDFNNRCAYNFT